MRMLRGRTARIVRVLPCAGRPAAGRVPGLSAPRSGSVRQRLNREERHIAQALDVAHGVFAFVSIDGVATNGVFTNTVFSSSPVADPAR